MANLRFTQIDVFTSIPFLGNPAAVVQDGEKLSQHEMQAVAREMNLSETVFLLPPTADADYRVRIFTPRSELPFAGHPTIAAAFAFESLRGASAPHKTVLRQECGIGVVPVETRSGPDGRWYAMTQTLMGFTETTMDGDSCARILGCPREAIGRTPPAVVSTGVPWLIVPVRDVAALSGLAPNPSLVESACASAKARGLTVFAMPERWPDEPLRVRSFAPAEGVSEDPVCGSGNGSVAAYLLRHGRITPPVSYRASQGIEVGRPGVLAIEVARTHPAACEIRVGGQAVPVAEGTIRIPG
ncbi:MAG: PhzF family phenazine biosynthesis protein [Acidiferrobacteraceae bacterium]